MVKKQNISTLKQQHSLKQLTIVASQPRRNWMFANESKNKRYYQTSQPANRTRRAGTNEMKQARRLKPLAKFHPRARSLQTHRGGPVE